MRKSFLALVVAVMMTAGTASADRGFWFGGGTGNSADWITVMNIVNTDTTSALVTVAFYKQDATLIGSTTRTLAANEGWNFTTASVGNLAATVFDDATASGGTQRGSVKITDNKTAGLVVGYTSIFNSAQSSGFNFRHQD